MGSVVIVYFVKFNHQSNLFLPASSGVSLPLSWILHDYKTHNAAKMAANGLLARVIVFNDKIIMVMINRNEKPFKIEI